MFLVILWMFVGVINELIDNKVVSYILSAIAIGLFILAVVKYFKT